MWKYKVGIFSVVNKNGVEIEQEILKEIDAQVMDIQYGRLAQVPLRDQARAGDGNELIHQFSPAFFSFLLAGSLMLISFSSSRLIEKS